MQLQGWEALLFFLLAILTLFMGVFVVSARVAVHSALCLISTLVNVAFLFILLRAEFVAGVQILVYVGGVMVLFLFVIMLVQTRAEEESRVKLYTGQMAPAVVVSILLACAFFSSIFVAQAGFKPPNRTAIPEIQEAATAGTGAISKDTQSVGEALYRQAALPFEIASLLLLVAIVGAVLLARAAKKEKIYE